MKKVALFSVFPALLLALASAAYADTVTIGTYATGQTAGSMGYTASNPLTYEGYQSATWNGTTYNLNGTYTAAGSSTTYNLGTNPGTWSPAVGSSEWVSNAAGTQPGGGVTDPTGNYTYEQTFTAAGGPGTYSGTLQVQADDTVEIILNGTLNANGTVTGGTTLVTFGALGGDSECADNQPNCTSVDTVSLSGIALNAGTNTLIVVDEQTVYDAGVDYQLMLTTPEGGAALMYLLLAGLACFGTMLFSRNQLGKCTAA